MHNVSETVKTPRLRQLFFGLTYGIDNAKTKTRIFVYLYSCHITLLFQDRPPDDIVA